MMHSFDSLMRTVRILCAVILLIAIFMSLSVLAAAPQKGKVEAKESSTSSQRQRPAADSPNAVANSMTLLAYHTNVLMDGVATTSAQVSSDIAEGARTGILATARAIQKGAATTARGVGTGLAFVGRGVGNGVSLIIRTPGNVLRAVSNAPVVNGFIRPVDHTEVPIIDPNSPELRAALAALPADTDKTPSSKSSVKPQWPIHGAITTFFGVDHWPFQRTHTGMDISDGQAPGITPVRPFRPGRVIDTIHSYYGLGNHVIVDHGNGVTSVYAHLASISVQPGQKVDLKTVLGHEGSTGASTGTHLHFEIRVHGKAADPRQFISGQP